MIKWSWIGRIIKSIYDVIQQLISDQKVRLFPLFQGFFVALFYCFLNEEVCFATIIFNLIHWHSITSKIQIWNVSQRLFRFYFKSLTNFFSSFLLKFIGEICTEEEVQHSSRKSHLGHKMYKNFHWLGQWHHDTERPRGPHQWQPPNECIQSQW